MHNVELRKHAPFQARTRNRRSPLRPCTCVVHDTFLALALQALLKNHPWRR